MFENQETWPHNWYYLNENVIQYQYVKLMEKSIECTKSKILEQISQTGIDIYQTSDQIEIVGGTNTKK